MLATFTGHTLPIWANWSQFLGAATLLTGLGGAYVKHQCHVRGCLRLSWAVHPDHGHQVCKHHHPDDPPAA